MRMTWTKGAVIVAVAAVVAVTAGVITGVLPLDTALAIGRALLMGE
ncbi:hypothetical protein [Roseospira marina]|nr:hypothetical protein [Roseospira marina]MBB4316050.1 hypothetical protein [Roseospira marina]MBB5089232.1 hypothetical protein [Roseospira marina]